MKKYKIIFTVGIALLVSYHLVWFSIYYLKYSPYTENIPKTENGKYVLQENDYYFSVKKPSYLTLTGNLAVMNEKENLSLIIWPLLTGGYEYGLQILDDDGVQYSVMIDSDSNYLVDDSSGDLNETHMNKLIETKRAEIEEIMSEANGYGIFNFV